ncbi:MAG TPA: 3-dehydroquinate synthase [Pyrinomonadaceae bacterium]|nr:3-dehydroquinate synthase [Pyrinomonadaceae bacterium]
MTERINVTTRQGRSTYPISIDAGSLSTIGAIAAGIARGAKVAIIANQTVNCLYGSTVTRSLKQAGLNPVTHLIGDGERFKSLKTLEGTLKFLGENKFSRTDIIVALGGGVVGDLAGFAAAVYLRGIKFIQVPTTLLSMIDSSVGGKTGINTSFGKNLVGAFYQPSAVLIDPDVLQTLPKRELTAGFCEAVKQGAIGGRKLLQLTEDALNNIGQFDRFLAEQIRFKALIVSSDERESTEKADAKSRKILNFGHTFGHALEKVTNYRRFKHGEAVGHGIIFAAELSKKLELLTADEVELLNGVVHRAGKLPTLHGIDPADILEAFNFDKKVIGSSLQWILLEGIGKPVIKSGTEVPTTAVKDTIRKVLSR